MLVNGKQVQDPNSDGSETGVPPGWHVAPNGTFRPGPDPNRVAAPSLGPMVDKGGTATHQPPAATPPAATPTPAGPSTAPIPAPTAPAPAAPAPPPTPMGMASPMASLQAAADPGAGWASPGQASALRPGLGQRKPMAISQLFGGSAY